MDPARIRSLIVTPWRRRSPPAPNRKLARLRSYLSLSHLPRSLPPLTPAPACPSITRRHRRSPLRQTLDQRCSPSTRKNRRRPRIHLLLKLQRPRPLQPPGRSLHLQPRHQTPPLRRRLVSSPPAPPRQIPRSSRRPPAFAEPIHSFALKGGDLI